MTVTQRILTDVPEEDQAELSRQAGRRTNMTGWRYSDALRAEQAEYVSVGRDEYMRRSAEADRVARTLGYIR